jgi:hypothetical protein
MKLLFWIGIAMITYDFLGHFVVALARMNGGFVARLWNSYSKTVWPSISDNLTYDLFWSAWFAAALLCLIAGRGY